MFGPHACILADLNGNRLAEAIVVVQVGFSLVSSEWIALSWESAIENPEPAGIRESNCFSSYYFIVRVHCTWRFGCIRGMLSIGEYSRFNLFCHLSFGSLSVVGITYKNWIHANVMQCIWNCSVSTLRLLNLHISFSLELSDVHGYLTIILEACATHISIMGDNSTLSSPAFFHILNHLRNFVCHPVMPGGVPS